MLASIRLFAPVATYRSQVKADAGGIGTAPVVTHTPVVVMLEPTFALRLITVRQW
jgi:hypothetical protein